MQAEDSNSFSLLIKGAAGLVAVVLLFIVLICCMKNKRLKSAPVQTAHDK